MKSKILGLLAVGLLAVGLLAGSMAAQAAITFNLTTDLQSPSATGTFAGFITFNSADVSPGNTVFATNFLDWGFTWGTDLAVSPTTPGAGWVTGYDFITFDSNAEITKWAICVSTPADCYYTSVPGFYSDSDGNLNNTYPSTNYGVSQSWARAVPEPGTLALLGLGLVGLGLSRKRLAAD